MKFSYKLLPVLLIGCSGLWAQESHDHGAPEKLGQVSFAISCKPSSQAEFNRGVALLHSFAYAAANTTFRKVVNEDPQCAMAHWGLVMSDFHQLWEPHLAAQILPGDTKEIEAALTMEGTKREKGYLKALSLIFLNADKEPYSARSLRYEHAMDELAGEHKDDLEAQVFYALALLSNASMSDRSHSRQKKALAILEPLDREHPEHPGITHYIIHACDSSELASKGLDAARKYAQVAPSAPHALHMPSHIFTRLGLWQDSINSNLAASKSAHEHGDIGEELHAMDYLVYAYLQLGRNDDAAGVIERLKTLPNASGGEFKVGYAATAMPVRYALERHRWDEASRMMPANGAPPYPAALAVWARGLGRTRGQHLSAVPEETAKLQQLEDQLQAAGDQYWAAQIQILRKEIVAWAAQATGHKQEAEMTMRAAADEEDAMEKSPATPGPVIPAREQLGELLLEQHRPSEAAVAFRATLNNAPGRRGATEGLAKASQSVVQK
jgi:tetratricopeptide (TPR) repeat protein